MLSPDLAAPPAGLASSFFGRFCESVAPIRPKGGGLHAPWCGGSAGRATANV